MESRDQDVSLFNDAEWVNDLAFLTDVTHLSKLNGQLQGKKQLANKMFEHIAFFQKKLDLFDGQFSNSALTHFPCLKSRKEEGVVINCEKYGTMIKKLCAVFGDRFSDFSKP